MWVTLPEWKKKTAMLMHDHQQQLTAWIASSNLLQQSCFMQPSIGLWNILEHL